MNEKAIKSVIFLGLIYFLTRGILLFTFPIFNDEASHTEWGLRIINGDSPPFFTLYDGKPPLLFWLYGFLSKIFWDPFVGPRLASLLFGAAAIIGLAKLAEKILGKEYRFWTALLYIVTPLFAFYDVQALAEVAISAISIWGTYLLLKISEERRLDISFWLGILFGSGFWIKPNAALLVIPLLIIASAVFLIKKIERKFIFKFVLTFLSGYSLSLLPLLFQKQFSVIFLRNERYSLSLKEILAFPVNIWLKNLRDVLEITFWQLTPLFFLGIGAGVYYLWKEKTSIFLKLFFAWTVFPVIFLILIARNINPRYIVSFFPLFAIIAVYGLRRFLLKNFPNLQVYFLFLPAFLLTILLVANTASYLRLISFFTKTSDAMVYLSGFSSGYGVGEAISYLKSEGKERPILVGVRVDTGNPESAVLAYFGFGQFKNIRAGYLDSRLLKSKKELEKYAAGGLPLYFVGRNDNLTGLNNLFDEVARFPKPLGPDFVGIFRMKGDIVWELVQ